MSDKVTVEGPEAATKAVGTGPFAFKEWLQGDHITMIKNQNYWLSGRPYLDQVNVTIIKDPQAQLAQLEAGSIDVVRNPSLRDFARLRADSNYAALLHPFAGTFYMQGVNVLNAPFDNKTVRQALSCAIDRKRIAESVLLGTGQPTSMPWLSNSAAYEPSKDQGRAFTAGLHTLELVLLHQRLGGLRGPTRRVPGARTRTSSPNRVSGVSPRLTRIPYHLTGELRRTAASVP
jgi:ABC-type transport system substrate-binding protein